MAVAAAQAWVELSPVSEPAAVGTGSAITYGNGRLWGVCPNEDSDYTYFEYYDPNTAAWVYPEEDPAEYYLENTAITFQWMNDGAVFVVGVEDGDPTLYWYDPVEETWDSDLIEDFPLGTGASIAFRPVPVYSMLDHVPGWLYCLAGNGREFWRYSIPGFGGPEAIDGICPGQGAAIADQTPGFIWPEVEGAQMYALTVSPNEDMSDPVVAVTTNEPRYEVTERLSNGTYYWQTAVLHEDEWTWSAVHSFTLEGGWTQLESIPTAVSDGAALAYEKDYYGDERLIALVGGGSYNYYHYIVSQDTWVESSSTPPNQNVGTSLVTHEATEELGSTPWAIFGQGSDDRPWYHHWRFGWKPDTLSGHALPQSLGPGASLAYGLEGSDHYLYLTIGEDEYGPRNNFYKLLLPWDDEGEEASPVRTGIARAHVISRFDEVAVEYQLRVPAHVRAAIHDAAGRRVGVLEAGDQPAGMHRLSWRTDAQGRNVGPGAYFVILNTGDEQVRLKAIVR
jgi:hypothetical protein